MMLNKMIDKSNSKLMNINPNKDGRAIHDFDVQILIDFANWPQVSRNISASSSVHLIWGFICSKLSFMFMSNLHW